MRVPRLWEILSQAGHDVVVHGVPQTYPINPIRGAMVSCFLTPSTKSQYTYPAELKPVVEQVAGGYVLDVEDFRTDDKAALLGRVHDKTAIHFQVARHFIATLPWQFFMMVEMGVDRVHHGFWRFMDPANRNYQAGNPLEDSIREYYRAVDREVGELIAMLPSDCAIMVVSDHGAKSMEGGVCVNEWLIERGYLTLKEYPHKPTPIGAASIDWDRTKAWGDGGYYARIFMNVRGREPQGTIAPGDYEAMRGEPRPVSLGSDLRRAGPPAGNPRTAAPGHLSRGQRRRARPNRLFRRSQLALGGQRRPQNHPDLRQRHRPR